MTVLYVTSLHSGDGKTALCAGLGHLLRQQGRRATLFKPVRLAQASTQAEPDADATFFARLTATEPPSGWPLALSQEEAKEGLHPSSQQAIRALRQQLSRQATDLVVEGPPMTSASGEPLAVTRDLPEALDARTILLVRYTAQLTGVEVLAAARALGARLLGVVVNAVPRYRNQDVKANIVEHLKEAGVPVLAVLPEERCLLGITVGQLAEHLGGEFLILEEKRYQLVDHLMIGGLVLDWGVHYFAQSETKAVIVRGDRPDIQMSALHTPTQCLVLTGGHRPVQYIEYEAREEGIPLILVHKDTLATAQELESLFDQVSIHHPKKAECFARLLAQALDPQLLA